MKMAIIGAGSAFGGRIAVDVLSREPLQAATIALCDIHAERLETVRRYVEKVRDSHNLPAKVVASTDRREILAGADAVLIAVAIGGPAYYGHPFEAEIEIPQRYGVIQTVGDTLGPGGLMRALRSAPPMLQMMRDINELAPRAVTMNYTNPMANLPAGCAALCRTNIGFQELAVEAIRHRSRELAMQALLLDPITQAHCTINEARAMFDELWEAEGELLVEYR